MSLHVLYCIGVPFSRRDPIYLVRGGNDIEERSGFERGDVITLAANVVLAGPSFTSLTIMRLLLYNYYKYRVCCVCVVFSKK